MKKKTIDHFLGKLKSISNQVTNNGEKNFFESNQKIQ